MKGLVLIKIDLIVFELAIVSLALSLLVENAEEIASSISL